MSTLAWPLALVDCVGVLAPVHVVTELATPLAASPESGTSPPGARPFGTLDCGKVAECCAASAAARAALCAACMAWIACVARVAAPEACCAAEIAAFIASVGAEITAPVPLFGDRA